MLLHGLTFALRTSSYCPHHVAYLTSHTSRRIPHVAYLTSHTSRRIPLRIARIALRSSRPRSTPVERSHDSHHVNWPINPVRIHHPLDGVRAFVVVVEY